MEISETVKSSILSIQNELRENIQNHHELVLHLKENDKLNDEIRPQLLEIKKQILKLNNKQKVFIEQLKKEINDNILNGFTGTPSYNFNLYDIKPGQLESKKRRRKDLVISSNQQSQKSEFESPCPSPPASPTPSFSSSISDEDSVGFPDPENTSPKQVKMTLLPAPIRPRPKLIPEKDDKYPRNLRRDPVTNYMIKTRQSEKVSLSTTVKEIPVYNSPTPSPEPMDVETQKLRLMAALNLIPIAMLSELRNRKVERKRRSTANNPHFVYNNDWEVPVFKRSKTYLSPNKTQNKVKSEECLTRSRSVTPKEDEKVKPENSKSKANGIDIPNLPADLTVEKVESANSKLPPSSATKACVVCQSPNGLLSICKVCSCGYHLRCNSNILHCPNCKMLDTTSTGVTGDGTGEDVSVSSGRSSVSGKEEFAAKCPNIANSYNQLQDYIKKHKEVDEVTLIAEKKSLKMELVLENHRLYSEKAKLEERATHLSEKILAQEEFQARKRKEETIIRDKIKVIVDFVSLFKTLNHVEKDNPTEVTEVKIEDEKEVKEIQDKEQIIVKNDAKSLSELSSDDEMNGDDVEFLSEDSSIISEACDNISEDEDDDDEDNDDEFDESSDFTDKEDEVRSISDNNITYSPEFLEDDGVGVELEHSEDHQQDDDDIKLTQTLNGVVDERINLSG